MLIAVAKARVLESTAQFNGNLFASFSNNLTPKREGLNIPKMEIKQSQESTDNYDIQDIAVDLKWEDNFDVPSEKDRSADFVASLIPEQPLNTKNREAFSNDLAGFGSDADMSGIVEEEDQASIWLPSHPSIGGTSAVENGVDTGSSSRYDETHYSRGITGKTGLMGSHGTGLILTELPVFPSPRRNPTSFFTNSASSSQQADMSVSRSTAPFPWGSNAPQSSASTTSTGDVQSTQNYGGARVKVACKTCSELLLICSERPKIKTVEKSMAVELLAHRRRLAAVLESNVPTQASSVYMASQRIGTPSTVASQSRAMILTIRGACVLEMPFEGPSAQEEVECVLRPRDGLFYRRVVCPRCRVTPVAVNLTPSEDQQHIIPGWKGVIIVGILSDQRQQPRSGAGDDTSEIGTVWLTPGEIKTL